MASGSSGLKCNVQKFRGSLSVFEAFGNHAEGEGLHASDGFVTIGAIAHDSGQCRYFGQPPAIIFALKLNGKGHPWYCSIRASSLTTAWSRRAELFAQFCRSGARLKASALGTRREGSPLEHLC